MFREACPNGLEGVIAKRADSPYRAHALERLAEVEVRRRAGARDRRLHRAAGVADRLRRAARRLLRGRTAALRRQGRHRLRPRTLASSASAPARARARRPAVRRRAPGPARHALGRAGAGGPVGFAEWTRDGRLRHPRFLGLRDDKPAARRRARAARRERRDQPPREAAVPRRRDHQGRPRRLLRGRSPLDAPARARPAGEHAALPRRHRRQGLLPQGRARLLPGLDRARRIAEGGRHGHPRADPRTPTRCATSPPEHDHAARLPLARRPPPPARPARVRPRPGGGQRLRHGTARRPLDGRPARELELVPFAQVTGSKGIHIWTPLRRRANTTR